MILPALPGLPEQGYWACPAGPEEVRFRFDTTQTPPRPAMAWLTCPHGRWTNLEQAQLAHRDTQDAASTEVLLPARTELIDVASSGAATAFCDTGPSEAMPAWQNGRQIEHYRCAHGFWHSFDEAAAAHVREPEVVEYTELPTTEIDS